MNDDLTRRQQLAALGLTDWRIRPGGALDKPGAPAKPVGPAPEAAAEATTPTMEAAASPAPESGQIAADAGDLLAEPSAEGSADNSPAALDWPALADWLAAQDHRGATQPVFGIGAQDADVLIVGEAPGANEDAQGVPFVGRAGQLLDRMLFAIGCSRETNVYITNICKFRPPDNRDPTREEIAADWPVLERQIDLMQPKLVVAVGRIAAQTLLDCKTPLGKLRGQLHRYPRRDLDVLVTYHPAYLLRSPDQKNKAWADLKVIARHIGSLAERAA